MNFIDREIELARLRSLYERPSSALAVIYGRRLLGKIRLLKEFCADLPHVYYMADLAGESLQRESLAGMMAESLESTSWPTPPFEHGMICSRRSTDSDPGTKNTF